MKIALVSNYGDLKPLSEYAIHLRAGLQLHFDEVVLISNKGATPDASVRQTYDYGSPLLALQVIGALRAERPDVVLVNTTFSSWGGMIANFIGLLLPLILRILGFKVLVLMHDLPHTMDIKKSGYKLTWAHWLAINLACHAVAQAHRVIFTLEHNVTYFRDHFGGRVELIPHGLLGEVDEGEYPAETNILMFGRWGRAKKVETVIAAFLESNISGTLTVAGTSADSCPGYIEEVVAQYGHLPNVVFTGYIKEEEVKALFHHASLVILPHNSNPGASGSLYQAVQYGRPVLVRHNPAFEAMAAEAGIELMYFESDEELVTTLQSFAEVQSQAREVALNNASTIRPLTMSNLARRYLVLSEEISEVYAFGNAVGSFGGD